MKITIIEDNCGLAEKIKKKLNRNNYISTIYNSKEKFLENNSETSDLYILDLNLGKSCDEGFDIINIIRKEKKSKVPIIITSGYSNIENKVYGLDLGADDYLAKPFLFDELLARIRSLSRRNSDEKTSEITYNNLTFDLNSKSFISGIEKNIHFTKKEAMLIELFILNKNKIISKEKLVKSIWGDDKTIGVKDNTINVTFFNLRSKLGDKFKIETLVGEGYILR